MNDTDEASEKPKHPADALAELAAGKPTEADVPPSPDEPPDHADALSRMAQQRRQAPADIAPQPEAIDPAIAEQTGLAGDDAFRARRARSRSIDAHQSRGRWTSYKKVMIPALVVVGGLLMLVGVLSVLLLIRRADRGPADQRLVQMALVSFPLGSLLMFGAWWFHRDVTGR